MKKILLFIFCISAFSCSSPENSTEPYIKFSQIPMAEVGGTVRLESIEGRVFNSSPQYKIVIYTRSGEWYVQPFADKPFTDIRANSTFSTLVHLGTEYAAVLVKPEFVPKPKITGLPEKGGDVIAVAVVNGTPMYWQTWWFRTILLLIAVFLVIAFFRLRFRTMANELNVRFEERLAERTRIAQELHDSLLQGIVGVAMQLDVAVDQLPENSPAKPQLNRIIENIEQVIKEGRNTLQGLRVSNGNDFVNLERRFSQIREDLDSGEKIDFQFIEKGQPQTLCPVIADEVYYIVREALINSFQHSEADKIKVEIEYAPHDFNISIRDNGRGIPLKVLNSGREGHFGLSGMRERATKIGADLKIESLINKGTEIKLSVPNHIAFETSAKNYPFRLLGKLSSRKTAGKELEK